MRVIDDDTKLDTLIDPNLPRGLALPPRPRGALVYGGVASPFPAALKIPRSEWQARCEEMARDKTRLSDIMKFEGVKVKYQNPLLYCWVFATTSTVEVTNILQGQKYLSLSPASAGAQIKNFRNEGGWGKQALEWIIRYGVGPTSMWPDNSLKKTLLTPALKNAARANRVTEWYELRSLDLDEIISCLLNRIPVSAGYDWWGHQVMLVDAIWLNGAIAILFQNSWGTTWGDLGWGVLQGQKMYANDAVCPVVTTGVSSIIRPVGHPLAL